MDKTAISFTDCPVNSCKCNNLKVSSSNHIDSRYVHCILLVTRVQLQKKVEILTKVAFFCFSIGNIESFFCIFIVVVQNTNHLLHYCETVEETKVKN